MLKKYLIDFILQPHPKSIINTYFRSNISAPNNKVTPNRVQIGNAILKRNSETKTDDNSSAASGQSKPRSYDGRIR
jgi:hypothetical protein